MNAIENLFINSQNRSLLFLSDIHLIYIRTPLAISFMVFIKKNLC